jgi:hypothetical protein
VTLRLPNAHNVIIEPQKLTYLLVRDPGKAKFWTGFGFDPSNPQELDAALRHHVQRNAIDEVFITPHGAKFNVRCNIRTPNGRNPCVLSVWIFDLGKTGARLVTAYVSNRP